MTEHDWKVAYAQIMSLGHDKSVECAQCGAVALRHRSGEWKLKDSNTERDCDQEKVMWPIRAAHEL